MYTYNRNQKSWPKTVGKEKLQGGSYWSLLDFLISTRNDGNCHLLVVSKPLMAVGKSLYCIYTLITSVLCLIEASLSTTLLASLNQCLVITPWSITYFFICTGSKIELI
uniref:Putative ovule protein n=1 Tax=Solanum chacoense TaxID=4108 RepID=A0A0V0HSZ2_SOLCH